MKSESSTLPLHCSTQDLDSLHVGSHIRQFLTDGTSLDDAKRRNIITKTAKHYFLHDGKLYKKRCGIVREICDSFNLRRKALQEAHNGMAHYGIESTFTYLASHYWFPHGQVCLPLYHAMPEMSKIHHITFLGLFHLCIHDFKYIHTLECRFRWPLSRGSVWIQVCLRRSRTDLSLGRDSLLFGKYSCPCSQFPFSRYYMSLWHPEINSFG